MQSRRMDRLEAECVVQTHPNRGTFRHTTTLVTTNCAPVLVSCNPNLLTLLQGSCIPSQRSGHHRGLVSAEMLSAHSLRNWFWCVAMLPPALISGDSQRLWHRLEEHFWRCLLRDSGWKGLLTLSRVWALRDQPKKDPSNGAEWQVLSFEGVFWEETISFDIHLSIRWRS